MTRNSYFANSIGILSLSMIALASLIAIPIISNESTFAVMVYIGILVISPFIILRFFCTKCPCTDRCAHYFPGKIVTRLFKMREGPYTTSDMIFFGMTVIILFGYPQVWLVQEPLILAVFWILVILAAPQIVLFLCARCGNTYCPVKKIRGSTRITEDAI